MNKITQYVHGQVVTSMGMGADKGGVIVTLSEFWSSDQKWHPVVTYLTSKDKARELYIGMPVSMGFFPTKESADDN